jgi:hypothetical protein
MDTEEFSQGSLLRRSSRTAARAATMRFQGGLSSDDDQDEYEYVKESKGSKPKRKQKDKDKQDKPAKLAAIDDASAAAPKALGMRSLFPLDAYVPTDINVRR